MCFLLTHRFRPGTSAPRTTATSGKPAMLLASPSMSPRSVTIPFQTIMARLACRARLSIIAMVARSAQPSTTSAAGSASPTSHPSASVSASASGSILAIFPSCIPLSSTSRFRRGHACVITASLLESRTHPKHVSAKLASSSIAFAGTFRCHWKARLETRPRCSLTFAVRTYISTWGHCLPTNTSATLHSCRCSLNGMQSHKRNLMLSSRVHSHCSRCRLLQQHITLLNFCQEHEAKKAVEHIFIALAYKMQCTSAFDDIGTCSPIQLCHNSLTSYSGPAPSATLSLATSLLRNKKILAIVLQNLSYPAF